MAALSLLFGLTVNLLKSEVLIPLVEGIKVGVLYKNQRPGIGIKSLPDHSTYILTQIMVSSIDKIKKSVFLFFWS